MYRLYFLLQIQMENLIMFKGIHFALTTLNYLHCDCVNLFKNLYWITK